MSKTITYKPTEELLALDESERIRWAIDLECGEFDQGKGKLFDGKRYCCLGVWEWINGTEDEEIFDRGIPSMLNNPPRIGDVLPCSIYCAEVDSGDVFTFFALNDNQQFTFKEIAQLLRGNNVTKTKQN